MKKNLQRTRTWLSILLLFMGMGVWSQAVIFSENMGTVATTTTLAAHINNDGFENSSTLTYTSGGIANSIDIRQTNVSSGYTGASGGANVFFAQGTSNPVERGFAIEGINASTFTNLQLQFAYRKEQAANLADLVVDYWNGTEYVNVPFTFNEAPDATAGWYLSPVINLPAAAQINGLKLRWFRSLAGTSTRIDDVVLRGTPTTPLLSVSVPTINGFSYALGSGPSPAQSFELVGANMNGSAVDINLPGNSDFEISLAENGPYGTSLSIPSYTGAATNVFVRLKQGLSTGNFSDQISVAGGGASSVTVNTTGFVSLVIYSFTGQVLTPTLALSNATASNFQVSSGTVAPDTGTPSGWSPIGSGIPTAISTGGWGATEVESAKNFFFTLEAAAGSVINLSNISFEYRTSAAGTAAITVEINGTAVATFDTPADVVNMFSAPLTGFDNLTSITVRIRGWNNGSRATNGNGNLRVNDVRLDGTIGVAIQLPPAPTAEDQPFCGAATVGDLVAVGDNLQWYNVAEGGVALETSEALVTGSYYVSQTIDGIESTRTEITVTINPIPDAPLVESPSIFANGQTLADINVQGENIVWYDAAVAGNVLPSSTVLVDGVSYFVSQTVNGCESERAEVMAQLTTIPLTALRPDFCNITLTALGGNLFASFVPDATAFRFKVSLAGFPDEVVETPGMLFRLTELSNPQFGVTYSIQVAAQVDGQWGAYGSACSVTTPATIPTTQLRAPFCNITVTAPTANLFADPVSGATAVRFRVSLNGNEVQVIETTSLSFSLAQLANPLSNTTYSVEVAAQVAGTWGAYGPACNVTTPPFAATRLRDGFCNVVITNPNANLFARPVQNADAFRYRVTNLTTNAVDVVVRDGSNILRFVLTTASSYSPDNHQYAVEVAARVGGVWGDFTEICSVTVGQSSSARENAMSGHTYKAYPNPFTTQTTIAWTKSADTQAHISVYDVTGKLIQSIQTQESSVQLGQEYKAGVYLVTIIDGEQQIQTKVVKR